MIEPPVPLESFSFNCWVVPAQFEELHRWGSDPTRRGQKYENNQASVLIPKSACDSE
jgi:hypothetical protein